MAAQSNRNKLADLQKRLFASRFFTISVLLHFILVLTLGSVTLIKISQDPPDFTGDPGDGEASFVSNEEVAQAPPEQTQQMNQEMQTPDVTAPSVDTPQTTMDVITAQGATDASFNLPTFPGVTVSADASKIVSAPVAVAPGQGTGLPSGSDFKTLPKAVQQGIKGFTSGWAGKGGSAGPGSNPTQREFIFTAYLAKYKGGDWDSTNEINKDGRITKGSLPNLLYLMNKYSKGRIKANPHAEPLDLSSDQIFTIKPPFIFFTGHRDFVLTEKEVENLRKYIMLGGCIWGDSSLPGHRSRFDIAFRREMRRVIPDKDKDWEQLPANHALFTKRSNLYFPEITTPPPGMNYYAEPVYALKFVNEVAVIYTANDYGDMWQVGMTADWKYDLTRNEKGGYLVMSGHIWHRRGLYYRNISEESVANTYKFGTNLVIHLLTRWEDHVRSIPGNL